MNMKYSKACKFVFTLILMFYMVFGINEVYAKDSSDGMWKYTEYVGNKVKITDYLGDKETVEEIVIPETIDGNIVEDIDSNVFADCSQVTSIKMPKTIKNIYKEVFKNCSNLKTVDLNEGIVNIGTSAFSGCSSLTNIYIPKTVKGIGSGVFYGCNSLEEIVVDDDNKSYYSSGNAIISRNNHTLIAGCSTTNMPDTVLSIADYAFGGLDSLKEVYISSGVNNIFPNAFSNCSNIEKIVVDEDNKVLDSRNSDAIYLTEGDALVMGCKNTVLPDGVKAICVGAFDDCTGLTSLTISKDIYCISNNAFIGCTNLEEVNVAEDNKSYDSRDNCNAIIYTDGNRLIQGFKTTKIPDTVEVIDKQAFMSCYGLENITIPGSVTTISKYAFADCKDLKVVNMSEGLEVIGDYAFSECNSLENVIIPDGVKEIGVKAFNSCKCLKSISIPDSVTKISEDAFNGCENLKNIYVKKGSEAEKAIQNLISSGIIPAVEIKYFPEPEKDKKDDEPSEVPVDDKTPTPIEENAGNTTINPVTTSTVSPVPAVVGKKLTVPSAKAVFVVTSANPISPEVSYYKTTAKKAKSITVVDTITVNDITYKVTGISSKALSGNKKVKKVTVGANVTSIGSKAFYNCKKLKQLNINSKVLKKVGKNAIKGTNKKLKIKVAKKKLKKYKKLFKKKTGFTKTMKFAKGAETVHLVSQLN